MASLRGYIDDAVTDIQIDDTTGFPVNGGVVLIESELIRYTTATDRSILGCERGFNSTTAVEHDDKTAVEIQDTLVDLYVMQEYSDHGTPVDHKTGVGFAIKGTRYTDLDSGLIYSNLSDELDPVWTLIATGTPAGASGPVGAVQLSDGAGGFDNLTGLTADSNDGVLSTSPITVTGNDIRVVGGDFSVTDGNYTLESTSGQPGMVINESGSPTAFLTKNTGGGSLELNNEDGSILLEMAGNTKLSLTPNSAVVNKADGDPYITMDSANGAMEVYPGDNTNTYLILRGTDQYLAFHSPDGSGPYHGTLHCEPTNLHLSARSGRDIMLVTEENSSNITWRLGIDGVTTFPDSATLKLNSGGFRLLPGDDSGSLQLQGRSDGYADFTVIGNGTYILQSSVSNGNISRIVANDGVNWQLGTDQNIPIIVTTNNNAHTWTFGNDGSTTFPAGNNTVTIPNDNGLFIGNMNLWSETNIGHIETGNDELMLDSLDHVRITAGPTQNVYLNAGDTIFVDAPGGGVAINNVFNLYDSAGEAYFDTFNKHLNFTIGGGSQIRFGLSGLTTYLKANGTFQMAQLTADPAGLQSGDMWYRDDLGQWKGFNGTTTVTFTTV